MSQTDWTGTAVENYILREIREYVSRHPRFQENGGSVKGPYSIIDPSKDVQIVLSDSSANGDRMSPDYFICTEMGRAVLGKTEGHHGTFLEFVQETDPSMIKPDAGMYYMKVVSKSEDTQTFDVLVQHIEWVERRVSPGKGSIVHLDPRFSDSDVHPVNLATEFRKNGTRLFILSYDTNLQLVVGGTTLVPNVDYWYQEYRTIEVVSPSSGQRVVLNDTPLYRNDVVVVDTDEFTLRPGIDYVWERDGNSFYLPRGSYATFPLTVTGYFRSDPTTSTYIDEENYLGVTVTPGITTIPPETNYFINGDKYTVADTVQLPNGRLYTRNLLDIGDTLQGSVRFVVGETTVTMEKMTLDRTVIDGLVLGVGDRVAVDDELVIIVYPDICETYEVYGSKDGMSMKIDVKTNDIMTSNEITEMIKHYLLIHARDRMEGSGVTIFEASRSNSRTPRDPTNQTMNAVCTLTLSLMVDWEVKRPLITRVETIELSEIHVFGSKVADKFYATDRNRGKNGFIPRY